MQLWHKLVKHEVLLIGHEQLELLTKLLLSNEDLQPVAFCNSALECSVFSPSRKKLKVIEQYLVGLASCSTVKHEIRLAAMRWEIRHRRATGF